MDVVAEDLIVRGVLRIETLEGTAGFEFGIADLLSEEVATGGRRPVEAVTEDMTDFVVPAGARDARLAVPAVIGLLGSTGLA